MYKNWIQKLSQVPSIEDILINLITNKADIKATLVNINSLGNPPEACSAISALMISNPESSHILNLLSSQLGCGNQQQQSTNVPAPMMYNDSNQPQTGAINEPISQEATQEKT